MGVRHFLQIGPPPGWGRRGTRHDPHQEDTTANNRTARLRHRKPYFGVSSLYSGGYCRDARSPSASLVLRNVRPEGANEAGQLSRLASKSPSCEQDAGHSQARPHPARLPSVGPVDPLAYPQGYSRGDMLTPPSTRLTMLSRLHQREHRSLGRP